MKDLEAITAERERLIATSDRLEVAWRSFVQTRDLPDDLITEQEADGVDPVMTLVEEARTRLSRDIVEVGIFGHLNRGKSTLLNALLGLEVSSTAVTPATVKPVWVEYGDPRSAALVFDKPDEDGNDWTAVDPDIAVRASGYRPEFETDDDLERELDGRTVSKVVHRVPADLLKASVRVIDTPGLDDPDPEQAEELKARTLAELDRVTAAVIVFLSPPGISGQETALLRSLAERGVDKCFFVCNFYSPIWEEPETREQIVRHVQAATAQGQGPTADPVRLFEVNAKRGWLARAGDDDAAFSESGVSELRQELEAYLSGGVFSDLLETACGHLLGATASARHRIEERLDILSDPSRLDTVRKERQSAVDAARTSLDSICRQVSTQGRHLGEDVAQIAVEPYDRALAEVASISSKASLQALDERWAVRHETMTSRISTRLDAEMRLIERDAKGELQRVFDASIETEVSHDFTTPASLGTAGGSLVGVSDALESDWGVIGLSAGAGALAGGAIAGGAGMALIAMGPVGWIAGATLGALLAGSAAATASHNIVSPEAKDRIQAGLRERRAESSEAAAALATELTTRLTSELQRREREFARDAFEELEAVEAFLTDTSGLRRRIESTRDLLTELDDIEKQLEHT